jgi:hypothetical protein
VCVLGVGWPGEGEKEDAKGYVLSELGSCYLFKEGLNAYISFLSD